LFSGLVVWPGFGPVVIDPLPDVPAALGVEPVPGIAFVLSEPVPDMPVPVPVLPLEPGIVCDGEVKFESAPLLVLEPTPVPELEPVPTPAPVLAPPAPPEAPPAPPPPAPAANAAVVPNRTPANATAISFFMR